MTNKTLTDCDVTTQTAGNNTTRAASTAFVTTAVGGSAVPHGAISGFIPSAIAGTSTTASLTVSAGQASDSTNASYITKATTTSWLVSNGNALNGYQGGTTLPNSSTINFFAIANSAGANQGVFASLSLTPTLPASHTGGTFRLIFQATTTAAGALLPFVAYETAGGGILCKLTTAVLDISATTVTSTRSLLTLGSLPTGRMLAPQYRFNQNQVTVAQVIISSPDDTTVAPAPVTSGNYYSYFTDTPGFDTTGNLVNGVPVINNTHMTNTSSQLGFRSTASVVVYLVTTGWTDSRR